MTSMTPVSIAEQTATHVDAIDLSQPQLLGLFGGTDDTRALLRGASGAVVMARLNDQTPLGTVMSITDTYVLVRNRRTIRRLTLPG